MGQTQKQEKKMMNINENEANLKNDRKAKKQYQSTFIDNRIENLMIFIENERKGYCKNYVNYSQADIAEIACISRSTYIDYVKGHSDNLTVKALLEILRKLKIHEFDIMKFS